MAGGCTERHAGFRNPSCSPVQPGAYAATYALPMHSRGRPGPHAPARERRQPRRSEAAENFIHQSPAAHARAARSGLTIAGAGPVAGADNSHRKPATRPGVP